MIADKNESPRLKKRPASSSYEKKASEGNQNLIDSYDYLSNAASSGDCTGLIPSAPLNEAELESYNAVYKYQPPKLPASGGSHAED